MARTANNASPLVRTARKSSRGGTLGSKRRAPDDARQSILAAADRLFYSHGIGAVGVEAIAAAAGVTKRTLYYHFASKDDLVTTYLESRDSTTLAALRHAAEAGGELAGNRILQVFDFVERWSRRPGYHGCPFNNAVAEKTVAPQVTAIVRRHKATMRSWFVQQAAEGGVKHPDVLGAQLLVVLDGALNGTAVSATSEAAVAAKQIAVAILDRNGIHYSHTGRASHRRSTTPAAT